MSEPKDVYWIVQTNSFVRPTQYIQSITPGNYRASFDIEKAYHFPTLSEAKIASDAPGYWQCVHVIEIEPLMPVQEMESPAQITDLLKADDATIDPEGEFPKQVSEGLAASNTTQSLLPVN